MAIHTLFSSGRLPENKRGGITHMQQGVVWIAYKPHLRVASNSRGLFAMGFRRKKDKAAADKVLPKSTPRGNLGSLWSRSEWQRKRQERESCLRMLHERIHTRIHKLTHSSVTSSQPGVQQIGNPLRVLLNRLEWGGRL